MVAPHVNTIAGIADSAAAAASAGGIVNASNAVLYAAASACASTTFNAVLPGSNADSKPVMWLEVAQNPPQILWLMGL